MKKHILLVCCTFCILTSLFSHETVCLNMIVKNESAVICRCLDSVKPIIDYWVIVDTGSTDGTQDIIKNHMKDIPGELYEKPWVNFGHNRSEAFGLAKGAGDYILFMDADDFLEFTGPPSLPPLTKDLYSMWRGPKGFSYTKPQIVRSNLPWKWIGVTHEYLGCDSSFTTDLLTNVRYVSGDDGASSHDPMKFWKNVALLEEGLKQEPTNSRYAFYLAESYRDAGDLKKSIECYQKRIDMGGWEEEVFWSLYQIALLQNQLNMPREQVIESLYRAHRFRPHRVEPVYCLSEIYNQEGKYDLSYECIQGYQALPQPEHKDISFTIDWMSDYGLLFQKSICAYYVGAYQESLEACDALLARNDLPESWKTLTLSNRQFPLKILAEKSQ